MEAREGARGFSAIKEGGKGRREARRKGRERLLA